MHRHHRCSYRYGHKHLHGLLQPRVCLQRDRPIRPRYSGLRPCHRPEPQYADAYGNRGFAYAGKGQYDRTIQDYDRAIALNPNFGEAYYARGIVYDEKGQYDSAIQELDRAIALNPKYADAYNNRGFVYEEKGQYDRAIQDFDRAIALNPNLAEAYINRGGTYSKKGKYDRAIQDFDRAIALNFRPSGRLWDLFPTSSEYEQSANAQKSC
jgi:tetratricopeptide (TPR) repeat protein